MYHTTNIKALSVNYLKEGDVVPGEIMRINIGDKFEGYAKLIESSGDPWSFIDIIKNDEGENEEAVFIKQRWLVEWAHVEEVKDISFNDRLTQSMLVGKRTHRDVVYKSNDDWELYWNRQGITKDSGSGSGIKPSDDYGNIF